jgi:hypothetical protein
MRFLSLLVLSILVTGAGAQQEANFVVLPANQLHGLIATEGTWSPAKIDIERAETNLSQIANLKADNDVPNSTFRLDHLEQYFRQYVPVRREGRKLLYVNAFCNPESDWRTRLVIVFDGKSCFWQALYDPATKKYSHLKINGIASNYD